MRTALVGAVILFSILAGCAASGPQFSHSEEPHAASSVIYLYRPWVFQGGGASPPINLDGKEIGKLNNGGYLNMEAAPGEHTIAITEKFDLVTLRTWPVAKITVAAEPGKEYFIRYTTDAQPIVMGLQFTYSFREVSSELGMAEIQKTKLSN